MAFELQPNFLAMMSDVFARYPNKQAACIPLLHLCQQQHGWVDDDIIAFVAEHCDLTTAHVQGVVTFYSLFNQRPAGENEIYVCQTLSCVLRGSDKLLHHCEQRLGIKPGQTTADGKFTLKTAECLAACGQAPVMMINKKYYEHMTPERVDDIVDLLLKNPSTILNPVAASSASALLQNSASPPSLKSPSPKSQVEKSPQIEK